ncbi:MAG TPA: hypothetical protein VED59_02085, partial [Acidimicrobiales bacterium]|nr:hypothetical protein [Acidimicrobiales bacterium]
DPHGGGLSQAWVLAALGVWVAAAATAAALVMPALRTVRSLVLHEAARAVPADRPALARAGQRANRWALVCDLAFLCALALMVWRP